LKVQKAVVLETMSNVVRTINVSAINARKTPLSAMNVNKDWKQLIIVDVLISAVLLKEFAESMVLMLCLVPFGILVFAKHVHVMETK